MELGLYTFADVNPNPGRSKGAEGAERLKHLIEEIELADQVGLDVFGLGEHHRPDYAASVPAMARAQASVTGGRYGGLTRVTIWLAHRRV